MKVTVIEIKDSTVIVGLGDSDFYDDFEDSFELSYHQWDEYEWSLVLNTVGENSFLDSHTLLKVVKIVEHMNKYYTLKYGVLSKSEPREFKADHSFTV